MRVFASLAKSILTKYVEEKVDDDLSVNMDERRP